MKCIDLVIILQFNLINIYWASIMYKIQKLLMIIVANSYFMLTLCKAQFSCISLCNSHSNTMSQGAIIFNG